ncbi:armadillo repeat-containing protein 7 isoform X2 [Patella vulgata]|uniref:armadillo repeat-containing protein 7 isoform X2 n=1 Tax=Patella vulgata TaxID=6465 RepID=UPI00217F5459|nr:armadillo repeat-containing protein 7 isoform X2 [Patella vulgata]
MFSSKEQLDKRTGPHGIGRFSYLQSLVTEYQDTSDADAKKQVLSNLANFAYDPINYEYFRKLNILDIFLDALEDTDEDLIQFAVGGICNSCLDKENKCYFLENNGVQMIIKYLSSSNNETVLMAITTLMFLVTPQSKPDITSLPVVECMLRFSKSNNKRLCNLARVFLEDYCTKEKIQDAENFQKQFSTNQRDGSQNSVT